jgi:hypothetical protein
MKFALVDNNKTVAAKGLKGFCPICQEAVIPRCGLVKIPHWAHKRNTHCDKWWENETEWHRNWKNHFLEEWQEIVAIDDKTGEKHIADIRTNFGMVVEFQHSYITAEERVSRESFYKNMAWVVDGTRRKTDYMKFLNAFKYKAIWHIPKDVIWILDHGYSYLPTEWLNSRFPVFFDFQGLLDNPTNDIIRERLWCLFPVRGNNINVLMDYPRDSFIDDIKGGGIQFKYDEIIKHANELIRLRNYRRRYGYY